MCGSKPWKTPIVIAHPLLCWYDPRGPISSHSNYTWPFLVVYNDTVSRALETAPTEPRFCRVLLPAVDRNAIALCGFVLTMLGIAPPHAAVRPLQCRSTIPWLNYITPTWSPSRTMHLLFSFPSFILPSWCTVACEGCPLFVGRSPCPSHSTSFSLNYRVADVSSDPNLTTCSCLVGSDVSWALEVDASWQSWKQVASNLPSTISFGSHGNLESRKQLISGFDIWLCFGL